MLEHPGCCLLCMATTERNMGKAMRWKMKLKSNKDVYFTWLEGNWKAITRATRCRNCSTLTGRNHWKPRQGRTVELWSYGTMVQLTHTHKHTHRLCSGPLGPKEMSVCGLIQPPVQALMMASTCCFNVTAGSPSILHWLWLPSAAGSSPLHTPPSISASFISPHFHLQFLLFNTSSYLHTPTA